MNTKTQIFIVGIILLVLVFIFFPFNTKEDQVSTGDPIKIGAILPLSGKFSRIGEDAKNGLEIRLKEINGSTGINGRLVELIVEDSSSDTTGAINAFQKLTSIDEVDIIFGGDVTPGTLAVAPIAEEKNVLFISFISPARKIADFGEMVIKVRPDLENQSIKMTDFILGKDLSKIAIMIDSSNDAVVPAAEAFEKYVSDQGGTIVAKETFTSSGSDFRAQLLKVKSANPEVVWVASLGKVGGLIVKQAQELGFKDTLFAGLSNWAVSDFIEAAGEFASNAVFTSEPFDCSNNKFAEYCENYREVNLNFEPSYYGGYAYDAFSLLLDAVSKLDSEEINPSSISSKILSMENFKGLMNEYDLTNNGKVSEGAYVIKTVENKEFTPVE